jgi:hypothetical protein
VASQLAPEVQERLERASSLGVDAASIAAAAGALAASMLPTVHQADTYMRQSQGAQLGERAAAAAFAASGPTLVGCAQAVTKLDPHATPRWADAVANGRRA